MHWLRSLVSVSVLLAILVAGCGQATVSPEIQKTVEVEKIIIKTVSPSEPQPAPARNPPKDKLLPQDKPSLYFSADPGRPVQKVVGFVFPDGSFAITASAFDQPIQIANGLFELGAVEIGPNAKGIGPGVYIVAIDTTKTGQDTDGLLIPPEKEEGVSLPFKVTRLDINPERGEKPAPGVYVGITAESVCFFVADAPGGAPGYWRYCSVPGSLLSVRDNFPLYQEKLLPEMNRTIEVLKAKGFLENANIDINQTISEMEDTKNIDRCVEGKQEPAACGSDIAGAPNLNFWEEVKITSDKQKNEPFSVVAGAVRVFKDLNIPGSETVKPGNYVVEFWFNTGFPAATISGLTDGGEKVVSQQISATAAIFLNADNPNEIVSQISAWHLANWCCFWQSNCP